MKLRHLVFFTCLNLFAPPVHSAVSWIDWSTGATQPFSNSSSSTGTISYTDSFQSVIANSLTSPDSTFPFSNPVNLLDIFQIPSASIIFIFNGVSPDTNSILTLGNLRTGNQFLVSAFDGLNNLIPLTIWTNLGQYPLYINDISLNLWNPSTGAVTGTGPSNSNSKNLFLGMTSGTAKIRVDFVNNDLGYEYLNVGIGQQTLPVDVPDVPEPTSLATIFAFRSIAGKLRQLRRRRKHPSPLKGSLLQGRAPRSPERQ